MMVRSCSVNRCNSTRSRRTSARSANPVATTDSCIALSVRSAICFPSPLLKVGSTTLSLTPVKPSFSSSSGNQGL